MESVGAARTSGLHIYSLDPGLCPLGLEEGLLVPGKNRMGGRLLILQGTWAAFQAGPHL